MRDRSLNSPVGRTFINNSTLLPKISRSFHFHNKLYNISSKLNTNGKSKFQNSFSFLSSINKNNLSFSLNNGRKKMPKIPHRRITSELDFSDNLLNNNTNSAGNSISNTNSSIDYNNAGNSNNNNIISIDKFNNVKTETMTKYRTEVKRKEEEKDDDKINGNLFGNQSVVESSNKTMENKNLYDNNLIQINVKEKNFGNPEESKDVINTNKFIYDNLSGSLFDIQKILYDKTVKDIEHYNKCKQKMQNIRVSTLVPKTNAEKIAVKQTEKSVITEEANEENMEKEEVEGEEEDDYLEKKKEKEKQKQKKLKQNREKEENKMKNRNILKADDYELYAEYKYSYKQFPEGREQFSMKYNLVDAVMFGGLVMNKNNNNVWILDPCIVFLNKYIFFI